MDEDFFLYYEEVAFSRAAQRLGWRVEYDASVNVVHRHPLQNRPISPKMRVITRHSKLLYFLKHLPRWQFLSLYWIVMIEAAIHGLWSDFRGRREDARAWRTIGKIGPQLRRGSQGRWPRVLILAESIEVPVRESTAASPVSTAGVIPSKNSEFASTRTHRQGRPKARRCWNRATTSPTDRSRGMIGLDDGRMSARANGVGSACTEALGRPCRTTASPARGAIRSRFGRCGCLRWRFSACSPAWRSSGMAT